MSDWTRDYFENAYLRRWRFEPPGEGTRKEATQFAGLLEVTPPARILDVACGHGHFSITMAEQGFEVVGIDASAAVLARATELASGMTNQPRFIRTDMRDIPTMDPFEGALLLDSFGFFDTEAEDRQVLIDIRERLIPGGRLLLKVINGGLIRSAFQNHHHAEEDGLTETIDRSLSEDMRVVTERIRLEDEHGVVHSERRQRLYTQRELHEALSNSGFTAEFYGGLNRETWQEDSRRFIVVARKVGP